MDDKTVKDNIALLKSNVLFNDISEQDLEKIAGLVQEQIYLPSEYIIKEDLNEANEFYLIKSGQVEILKHTQENNQQAEYCVATLTTGDSIGEVALLEDVHRTASARALTETVVLAISIKDIRELSTHKDHYNRIKFHLNQIQAEMAETPGFAKVALNLAKELTRRLNNTNLVTAESLKNELELSQLRVATGNFLIVVISTIALYTYCLSLLMTLAHDVASTTFIAIPMMFVFGSVIIYFMVSTGYPARFFGLTLMNWRQSVTEGILWSIPLMLVIVLFKWLYMQYIPYSYALFEGPNVHIRNLGLYDMASVIITYLTMTPLQELIARGALQGSMQNFLTGKHRVLSAIIISNLMFGMAHLHISLELALAVLVFGLFWGWMYTRHKTLVGVSLSHLIVGGWAFFVVGVEHILIT